jgi:AraC-like DNA-binding protein
MLSGVEARGEPCETYLSEAGIAPELLEQFGARVTVDQYVALFRCLLERLDDESIGFLSRPLKRGSLALMTRSALSAGTLELAMRRFAHTFHLLQDDVVLTLVREDALAGWALQLRDPSAAFPRFLHEMLLRFCWRLLAWLAGGKLPVVRFDFAFESPPYAGNYGKVFPATLKFSCRHSAFWFDATRLQERVRRDDAALRAFIDDVQAQLIVPKRSEAAVSADVRSHLQQTQPAWPDLVNTAEALRMSTSTLQRRLANEGTSFQSLKDELRRDTAIVRLNTSQVSLATLAFELGFSDSASFQRAFKLWTGSAPGSYRRSAR